VEVAVQENGTAGPWYDTATGTTNLGPVRNQATLTSPGATTTNWSLSIPAPAAGGTFAVFASAVNVNHIVNNSVQSSFTMSASLGEPNVTLSTPYVSPGSSFNASSTAFKPGEQVSFDFFGSVVATRTAGPKGYVPPAKIRVPTAATFGPTSLTLTGLTSGKTTSGTVYVRNNWTQSAHDPEHTAMEPNDTTIQAATATTLSTSPAIVDGTVYIGATDGGLYAFTPQGANPLDRANAPVVSITDSNWVCSTP
jgi:hypothetical protein